jgi:hypothetical protein
MRAVFAGRGAGMRRHACCPSLSRCAPATPLVDDVLGSMTTLQDEFCSLAVGTSNLILAAARTSACWARDCRRWGVDVRRWGVDGAMNRAPTGRGTFEAEVGHRIDIGAGSKQTIRFSQNDESNFRVTKFALFNLLPPGGPG